MTKRWWTKDAFSAELVNVIGNASLCSSVGFVKSASPELDQTETGFVLRHKLPVCGKWSNARIVFSFTPKSPGGGYYLVELLGFEGAKKSGTSD